jgi:catalase
MDPDFHRRDLADAIEAGAFPQYDLGIQVFPDTEDEMFAGIDLLDPTKIVPEELAPVQVIGTMTLNANPTNYFAETEQVAFHPGHLVPGIDVTNDALLQARLFSYVDTQITRLGGPNFAQIPINRPQAAVNDMLRDGFHQHAVHGGVAPYRPNSLDGGNPATADERKGAFVEVPQVLPPSAKVREQAATFDDHFSQVRLFFRSLTRVEQDHVIQAYTFELGKCYEENIRKRQLQALANIDDCLCAEVAAGLGLPAPRPTVELTDETPSPALSQLRGTWPVAGRKIGLVVDGGSDLAAVASARQDIIGAGMVPVVVAPRGGALSKGLEADRSYLTARSVEFDAVVLTGSGVPGPDAAPGRDAKAGAPVADLALDPRIALLVSEAYRHAKAVGAVSNGASLEAAGIPGDAPGVVGGKLPEIVSELTTLLGTHRVWDRFASTAAQE